MNTAVLALATLFAAQTPKPELITLPLSAASVDAQPTMSAWNSVVAEIGRRAKRLGVSVAIQRAKHDFLVGPAREQARDCGRDVDCLAEIGAALGAEILVIGVVSKRVALLAIRVADRSILAKARSPAKGTIDKRAVRAARRLARRLLKPLGRSGPRKRARAAAPPPDEGPPSSVPPVVPPPPSNGLLYIHRDALVGVTRITLDGDPIAFTADGFVSWPAAAGPHTLEATHFDGRSVMRAVRLEAGRTTEVTLPFTAPPPPPPPPLVTAAAAPAAPEDDRALTGTWWFWTVVGSVVVAGAATAAVLATGSKGGPTPADDTGTIRGTY